jgi:signal transduction histidine kinase
MVGILMKHELSTYQITLNISNNVPNTLQMKGNINSLVQVVNNIISNAIQASQNAPKREIDLSLNVYNNKNVIISIQDYGTGMSDKVKNTLFKQMITTKGKNGTGLGLFMSYSNIKAHFNGNITFKSEEGKGTTFDIILPI